MCFRRFDTMPVQIGLAREEMPCTVQMTHILDDKPTCRVAHE